MSTVQEIEQAVLSLSAQDRERFVEWLEVNAAKEWDAKFERAVKSGKLDKLADQAIADFRAGKYKKV